MSKQERGEGRLRAASQIRAVAKHVAQRNLAHDSNEAFVAHGVLKSVRSPD
jgi:hypothetical protein